MSINSINENPKMIKRWIEEEKQREKRYFENNPDSQILCFTKEVRASGFQFETSNQIKGFMPKHWKTIIPLAVKYYELAKKSEKANEQNYFLSFFKCKKASEVVPMLLEDYCSKKTKDLTRWFISDCLYSIRSKDYVKKYVDIAKNRDFGQNRQMIVLLLGKLKAEEAIPTLIELMEDEEVRLQTITALGDFRKEELRYQFERFANSNHSGWRKAALGALRKLDNN